MSSRSVNRELLGILLYFFSSWFASIVGKLIDRLPVAAVATYTGFILWRLFVRLDSERYPLRTYSDIVERIYGKRARQASSFLQNVQLLVVVCCFLPARLSETLT